MSETKHWVACCERCIAHECNFSRPTVIGCEYWEVHIRLQTCTCFFFARRNSGLWRKFDQLFGCPVTLSCQIWDLRFKAFEGDGPTRWYDALGFLYEQQLSIGRKYWKPKIGPMFHELWKSLRHLYDSTENIWRNYITYCFTNFLWWQWLWQDGMSFWNIYIGIVCKAEVDSRGDRGNRWVTVVVLLFSAWSLGPVSI